MNHNRTKLITILLFIIVTLIVLGSNVSLFDTPNIENDIPNIESLGSSSGASGYSLTVNCEISGMPKYASLLRLEKNPITNTTATTLAFKAFNFPKIDEYRKKPADCLVLTYDNNFLEFFGLSDIYLDKVNYTSVVSEWSENEIKSIADKFINNLGIYWDLDTPIEVRFNKIAPYRITIHGNGSTTIRSIGVWYSLYANDIILKGPGSDYYLVIADNKVIEAELHKPIISIERDVEIKISPEAAIETLITGRFGDDNFKYPKLYGPLPKTGQIIIDNLELVYFVDFLSLEPQTYLQLAYNIQGKLIGPDPFSCTCLAVSDVPP